MNRVIRWGAQNVTHTRRERMLAYAFIVSFMLMCLVEVG